MKSMLITKPIYKAKRQLEDFRRIWRHKFKVDLGISTPISFWEKLKYYRLGFPAEDYYRFKLKTNDYHD